MTQLQSIDHHDGNEEKMQKEKKAQNQNLNVLLRSAAENIIVKNLRARIKHHFHLCSHRSAAVHHMPPSQIK